MQTHAHRDSQQGDNPMQNGRQTHAGQKRGPPSEDTAIVMDHRRKRIIPAQSQLRHFKACRICNPDLFAHNSINDKIFGTLFSITNLPCVINT
jgi:hypothetical protein